MSFQEQFQWRFLALPANKCWHMWQSSDLDSPHNLPFGWGTGSPLMLPTSTYQNQPRVNPKNAIFVEQSNRTGSVQNITLLFKAQLQSTSSRETSLVIPRLEILPAIFGYANQGHRAKENTLLNVTPGLIFRWDPNRASGSASLRPLPSVKHLEHRPY